MKRLVYTLLLILLPSIVYSQIEVVKDTIAVPKQAEPSVVYPTFRKSRAAIYLDEHPSGYRMPAYQQPAQSREMTLNLPPLNIYQGPPLENKNTRYPFANDYNNAAIIGLSENLWIAGGSSQTTLLTYGAIRTAAANLNYRPDDKWTLSVGQSIRKYEIHGGQYTTVDLNANINYKITDRLNVDWHGQHSAFRQDAGLGSSIGGLYPEGVGLSNAFRPTSFTGMRLNYQATDWLYISGGPYGKRYEAFNQSANDYGINGDVSFRVTDRIKFGVHGQKSLRGKNNGFGTNGLYPQDYYGGSMEVRITENFGVEGGLIRELNPFTGKWENKPYIMPIFYVK